MPSPIKDITNQKFNLLTAIKFLEIKKIGKQQYHIWLFKCDCGNTKNMIKNQVMQSVVKSCGCLHKKNVFRKESGESSKTIIFHRYKRGARVRKLEFLLTKNEFFNIIKLNCYYCCEPPANIANNKSCYGAYIYNGVDRIDNNIGYVLGNCVPCCRQCNTAKMCMNELDFCKWVIKIYNNYAERILMEGYY